MKSPQNDAGQARVLRHLEITYRQEDDYKSALFHLFKAKDLAEGLDNPVNAAKVYRHIGVTYRMLAKKEDFSKNLNLAIEWIDKAQVIDRQKEYHDIAFDCYQLIATYILMKDLKCAQTYYSKANTILDNFQIFAEPPSCIFEVEQVCDSWYQALSI